ncbi:MAG: LiaI-LiaF-like domain-containing protein [Chloroflexota bacterium]
MYNLRRLFDGLMLVIIGGVLLLNTFGIVPWSIWYGVWRFWPVLLIAAGVSLVLDRAVPFTGLVCLALIAILTVSWFWPQTVRLPWQGLAFRTAREWRALTRQHDEVATSLPADASKPFKVNLDFRAGELRIGGTTSQAYNAKFDFYGERPLVNMDSDSNGPTLDIRAAGGSLGLPDWFLTDKGPWEIWDIAFNPDVPLDLTADLSAFDADLDLTQYNLTALNVDASAGDLTVRLGDKSAQQSIDIDSSAGAVKLYVGNAAKVEINASASAGSVEVVVPRGAALRILERSSLSSGNAKDLGLNKDGDYWISSGYDTAAQKIDIEFSGSASSLRIVR